MPKTKNLGNKRSFTRRMNKLLYILKQNIAKNKVELYIVI